MSKKPEQPPVQNAAMESYHPDEAFAQCFSEECYASSAEQEIAFDSWMAGAKHGHKAGHASAAGKLEAARKEARAEAFGEAAGILFDEAEGDIDWAKCMFVELSKPSSPESIARLEKTIAEQLERARKASSPASQSLGSPERGEE